MISILRGFISGEKSHKLLRIIKNVFEKNAPGWHSTKAIEPGPYFVAARASPDFCEAALVTENGKIIKVSYEPTKTYQTATFHELSTNNIWQSIVKGIKAITQNVNVMDIKGIGFVAAPALVCLDIKGNPVTVSVTSMYLGIFARTSKQASFRLLKNPFIPGDPNINCILSFDNRSLREAELINKTNHARLQYFGNSISPELQESKMLWLKRNLVEDCWSKLGHCMDLSDFLTWKATGSFTRSSSVLLSKWSYELTISGEEGWNAGFFNEIGMPEIVQNKFRILGTDVQRPGKPIANGLLGNVAKDMGLSAGLPVATSMLESHSGGLGIMGYRGDKLDNDVTTKLCIVFGTRASAHFVTSHHPVFMKGISGPFKDCILPDLWLNQAGQPTAESVMNYVISRHPAAPEIKKHLGKMHIHKYLNKILKLKAQKYKLPGRSFLTRDVHISPDFGGNYSPLKDPRIRGMASGLTLTGSQGSLALWYLVTMQSIAYSTRHILSAITEHGIPIKSIVIGGNLSKNTLFLYLHKDICQLPVIAPDEPRCKLIGAAILGAIASNHFRNFNEAINTMSGKGQVVMPDNNKQLMDYHNRKYQVFLKMYEHQLEYRRIMSGNDDKSEIIINM